MSIVLEEKNEPGQGKFVSWLGRLVQGISTITAGTLIGGMFLGLFGITFTRRYLSEEMLAGGAVGALWGVLKITRFEGALGFGLGSLAGAGIGVWLGGIFSAIWVTPIGGLVGMLLQRVFCGRRLLEEQPTIGLQERLLALFVAIGGVILGGIGGLFLSVWLCLIIVFQTWPWQANSSMDQAGLLLLPVGMLGGVISAVFGGRWLYLRLLPSPAPAEHSEQTIKEYEGWKQEQARDTPEGQTMSIEEGNVDRK